jgi:hypothetical protein
LGTAGAKVTGVSGAAAITAMFLVAVDKLRRPSLPTLELLVSFFQF